MSNKPKIYDITATGSTTPRDIRDRFSDVINVKDFGAVGDGVTDDTAAIQAALNAGINRKVYFPAGVYATSPLSVTSSGKFTIEGDNAELVLNTDINSEQACLSFSGVSKGRFVYPYAIEESATKIPALDMMGVGDLVIIRGNRLVQGETRSSWTEGCVHKIVAIEDGYARLENTTHINYEAPVEIDMTVTEAIDTTHCVFGNVDADERDMLYKCVAKTGANVGSSVPYRWITGWDNTTKIATFAIDNEATVPSNGRLAWVKAPAIGEVYTLVKNLTLEVVSPVQVNIRSLSIKGRRNSTSFGLEVKMSEYDDITGVNVSDFGYGGISIMESFRSTIRDCEVRDIVGTSTGYGITSRGCYAPYIRDCRISGCRSGFSTSHASVQDVYGVLDNIFVEAGNTKTTEDDYWLPFGSDGNQAIGDHGNGWRMLFRNCVGKDIYTPSAPRGYKPKFTNCQFFGLMGSAMFLNGTAGLEVYNCSWDFVVTPVNEGVCYGFRAHNTWNNNEDVIIRGCRFTNLMRALWYMDSTAKNIKNVKMHDNYVSFHENATMPTGVSGSQGTGHIVDANCEFINNYIVPLANRDDVSFFRPRYSCEVKENTPVRVGVGKWYIRSRKDEAFTIRTTEATNSRITINITAFSDSGVQAYGMMPYVGETLDWSPIGFAAHSATICLASEDAPVSEKVNITYKNDKVIFNNLYKDVRLLVELVGLNI